MAETDEDHQHRLRVDAERHALTRANQTPQKQLLERSKARDRMEASRNYTSAGFKDATRTQNILQGVFKVKKLEWNKNEKIQITLMLYLKISLVYLR